MLLLERDPLVLTEWPSGPRSRDVAAAERPGGSPQSPRRATLLTWAFLVAFLHIDRGVVTVASLDAIVRTGGPDLEGFGHAAALLAWHSLGLCTGGTVAGAAFQQVSAKLLVVLALLVDAGCLVALGLQEHPRVIATALLRFTSGASASVPLVFLPLWVDEFSPSEAAAQWMAVLQLGAPLGQLLGTLIASFATVAAHHPRGLDWRFALLVQAALLVLAVPRVLLAPSRQIEVPSITTFRARLDSLTMVPVDSSQAGARMHSFIRELREMSSGVTRNPLNISLTIVSCLLYATAACLTVWSAPYLASAGDAPLPIVALLISALSLAIAPACGVYAGAIICERQGGFEAGQRAVALRVAAGFTLIGALTGPFGGHVYGFFPRLALIWLWLLCAGAFLPTSTGALMTSMPSYLRSFYAASSLAVLHAVSFGLAPALLAGLMRLFGSASEALVFGVGIAFWATVPAAVVLLCASMRELDTTNERIPAGLSGVDDLTFSDVSYELARRRMTTTPL